MYLGHCYKDNIVTDKLKYKLSTSAVHGHVVTVIEESQFILLKNLFESHSLICSGKGEMAEKIIEFLDPKYQCGNFLYRGTTHGFEPGPFHERCDDKGPTLTLVQTIDGCFFGGFTSKSWQSLGGYLHDEEAFIFSLTRGTKHPIKKDKEMYAVNCHKDYLPRFGGGFDFYLFSQCNTNTSSFSEFGHTYELPTGMQFNTEVARCYLAGMYSFQVKELEVFQLKAV
mmetsp:Transcript_37022/g.27364  ORF Transcript_37022/g.27364 Transcript_37022/m.27364 type:complete len:226 (-) Transcript_37022:55-732(-)